MEFSRLIGIEQPTMAKIAFWLATSASPPKPHERFWLAAGETLRTLGLRYDAKVIFIDEARYFRQLDRSRHRAGGGTAREQGAIPLDGGRRDGRLAVRLQALPNGTDSRNVHGVALKRSVRLDKRCS
jgi:hypothetical protein